MLYEKGEKTKEKRLELLKNELNTLEAKIKDMNEAKNYLNYKIKLYEQDKLEEILKENV